MDSSDLSLTGREDSSEVSYLVYTESSSSFGNASDDEVFQDAAQFFTNELEYLENIRTSSQSSWLTRNSLGRNFDPLFETSSQSLDLRAAVESEYEIKLSPTSLPDVVERVFPEVESTDFNEDKSNNLAIKKFSVDGSIVTPQSLDLIAAVESEIKFKLSLSPLPNVVERVLPKVESTDFNEGKSNLVVEKLSSVDCSVVTPTRVSKRLIKRKCLVDCFEHQNTSHSVLYTEEQFNNLLMLQELQLLQAHLRKQRDLELESAKVLNEKESAIQFLKGMISDLYLVLQNLTFLVPYIYDRNQILEATLQEKQILLRKKRQDLKLVDQNFVDTSNKFSKFMEYYGRAKELLKICKSNQDKIMTEVNILQKMQLAHEKRCMITQFMLEKLEEIAEHPKTTGDSQFAAQTFLQVSLLKEEYLENQLKQAKIENFKLNNSLKELTAKLGGI